MFPRLNYSTARRRRVLVVALFFATLSVFGLPLAAGPLVVVLLCIVAQQIFGDGAAVIYEINQVSLIQEMVPASLQGRTHAVMRVIEWSAMIIGIVLSSWLGVQVGVHATLWIAASGGLLAPLYLLFSHIHSELYSSA